MLRIRTFPRTPLFPGAALWFRQSLFFRPVYWAFPAPSPCLGMPLNAIRISCLQNDRPATVVESHPCENPQTNCRRITSLRKKGGGGGVPSKLPMHGKVTAAARANLPFRQIALFLLVFAAAALCTFAQTPAPQAPQAATPQAATPQAATIEYAVLPREAIEGRLLRSTRPNIDRQAILQQIFEEAGCGGESLTAQPI